MQENDEAVIEPLDKAHIRELDFLGLMFYAYRDFVADPDLILERYGFGRAHHRVLYFVNRSPGLTVAELLNTLRITKQSLARVLKQLIDTGYIVQKEGERDRRKRLLYPTTSGRKLILDLSKPQSERFSRALEALSKDQRDVVKKFLTHMANRT